jgi:dCMP deaminase
MADEAIWSGRFRKLCDEVASWSEDRDFKVGAVIVGPGHEVRAMGYNGLPRGVVSADPDRFDRRSGEKFFWFEHAERNAIYNATRAGVSLAGCKIYVNRFPCADCARAIIQCGIICVECPAKPENDGKLDHSFSVAQTMLKEAGIGLEVTVGDQSKLRISQ